MGISRDDVRVDVGESSEEMRRVSHNQAQVILVGLSTPTVVGIAFASFAIGVALTAALWLIHLKTGKKAYISNSFSYF